jgi:hypothetical protein
MLEVNSFLVFVATSCNRNSCKSDNPEAICASTDNFNLVNGTENGFAGNFVAVQVRVSTMIYADHIKLEFAK